MADRKVLNIGGILLAAGGSSRLVRPKQLVEFQGKTLIRRAAETLANSYCTSTVVVLGAEIERSTAELNGLDVSICINEGWHLGMSSSIIEGLKSLIKTHPNLDAIVITLCDQPRVTLADINNLIAAFINTKSRIVAAQYNNTIGVPALFSKYLFDDLRRLDGDKGARQLIRNNIDRAATVDIKNAAIDIDTLDDADRLCQE